MYLDDDDIEISPELQAEAEELLRNPMSEEEQRALEAMERRANRVKTFGKNAGQPKTDRMKTVSLRVNTTMDQHLRYWSDKREVTMTEYITDAIREKIARENGDFDNPTIVTARLSELIDLVKTLTDTVNNTEKSTISMLESIIILSRDPKYMIDASETATHE